MSRYYIYIYIYVKLFSSFWRDCLRTQIIISGNLKPGGITWAHSLIKLDVLPCLRISILVKPGQFYWSFGVLKWHSQTAQEYQRRKMTLIKYIRIVCKRWREKMNCSSVESLEAACGLDWQLSPTDLAIFQTLHGKSLSAVFFLTLIVYF